MNKDKEVEAFKNGSLSKEESWTRFWRQAGKVFPQRKQDGSEG